MSVQTTDEVSTRPTGIVVTRVYTKPGVDPFSEVAWESTDIVLKDYRTGEINFEQLGTEFPAEWSMNARQIVASKYFRGKMGTPDREWSLKQVIGRVANKYADEGIRNNYFADTESADAFRAELTYMLLHQIFAYNSPVWFNVGTKAPQQVSACFLLAVEDDMEAILDWYKEEGMIFKGGSGAGVNLSRLRGSKELLSSGGQASGPVSFMRGADSSAGTIQSGGANRRAAKLVCLDVDHPDVMKFIEIKAREEDKIRALSAAGFDMGMASENYNSVQYQNANNSIRVSDEFMAAVRDDKMFSLHNRTDGSVAETLPARRIFEALSKAAWECADPGIQYGDTINKWHTCPESGRITTSNPCSEYMHLDNSSCNLASLNLLKFLTPDLRFDYLKFSQAVEIVISSMDISVSFADFPTEKIGKVTREYRQLGIGYSNLGALLMAMGLAYDSEGGRAIAASITSLMSATSYRQSAVIARAKGAYQGHARNAKAHLKVVGMHAAANEHLRLAPGTDVGIRDFATQEWADALDIGAVTGFRNAQISLLAPTGTISFMMDCDTTGVEPDFSLVKHKKMHGGGSMVIVNQTVPSALRNLGYSSAQIEGIVAFVKDNNSVVGAPGLDEKHYEVFDCATGERFISPMGHVNMMAAVQPFLSGAISKTVNLPADASVEDIANVYMSGWSLGLKALAVYRDGCKATQPLATSADKKAEDAPVVVPQRRRLPARRNGLTTSFEVGGASGYLTSSDTEDGQLGEIFLKLGKQGSTLAGVMDAFSIAVSIGLQYGIPLESFVDKFTGMQFEPRGMTSDPDIRLSSSVLDYVFKRLAVDYLSRDQREALGVLSMSERAAALEPVAESVETEPVAHTPAEQRLPRTAGFSLEAPICGRCGIAMRKAGVCWTCDSCGDTSGCS
ncbi:MAG: vitamin B12-dependent ribonucleotide reductase [Candidatus Nanopelagicales bacterium]